MADHRSLCGLRDSGQCPSANGNGDNDADPNTALENRAASFLLKKGRNLSEISTPFRPQGRTGAVAEQDKTFARRWRIGVAAGTLLVPLLLSRTHADGPRCPFRMTFHVPCPGCGLTRSMEDIWRADPALSFRHHPFGLPIFLLCWLVLAGDLGRLPNFGEKFAQFWKMRRVTVGVTTVLLGLWAARLALSAYGSSYFLW